MRGRFNETVPVQPTVPTNPDRGPVTAQSSAVVHHDPALEFDTFGTVQRGTARNVTVGGSFNISGRAGGSG